jgi:hypothetical protein
MAKTPAVGGTAGVLIYTTILRRLDEGAEKASVSHNFDPSGYLKLYKIAHSEMTMYKSNNSALVVASAAALWPRNRSICEGVINPKGPKQSRWPRLRGASRGPFPGANAGVYQTPRRRELVNFDQTPPFYRHTV